MGSGSPRERVWTAVSVAAYVIAVRWQHARLEDPGAGIHVPCSRVSGSCQASSQASAQCWRGFSSEPGLAANPGRRSRRSSCRRRCRARPFTPRFPIPQIRLRPRGRRWDDGWRSPSAACGRGTGLRLGVPWGGPRSRGSHIRRRPGLPGRPQPPTGSAPARSRPINRLRCRRPGACIAATTTRPTAAGTTMATATPTTATHTAHTTGTTTRTGRADPAGWPREAARPCA